MAERVVLHVGAMKSGTTYLQSTLFANKAALAAQGVLLPGAVWDEQIGAAKDFLGRGRPRPGIDHTGLWARLREEALGWNGTAVLSVEILGAAAEQKVRELVDSFGGARVEVVLTARDLNRNVPAMWQETLKNGRTWTWPAYLADVARSRPGCGVRPADRPQAGRLFWRQQGLDRIVRTWTDAVGPERLSLVTVPPPGSDRQLLLARFAHVVGFDPTGFVEGDRANPSLGVPSAAVLRRYNQVVERRGLDHPYLDVARKHVLAKIVLAGQSGDEPRLGFPVAAWVRESTEAAVSALKSLDLRLQGEWADLEPVPVPGLDPAEVPVEDMAHAVAQAHRRMSALLVPRFSRVGEPAAPEWAPRTEDPETVFEEGVEALVDLSAWALPRWGRDE